LPGGQTGCCVPQSCRDTESSSLGSLPGNQDNISR
jgi:hypothetical protein